MKPTQEQRAQMLARWEEIKENHARRDACVGPHDYSINLPPDRAGNYPCIHRCTKCHGTIGSIDRVYYLEGLRHGREEAARQTPLS